MSSALIEFQSVSISFEKRSLLFRRTDPGTLALDDVTLNVLPGRTLGIVGESGSGKSTLLRILLRLARPSSGRVVFDGKDVWGLRHHDLVAFRRRVQAVFQDPMSSFNPRQTLGAILAAPLEVHGIGTRAQRRDMIVDALGWVGLTSDLITRYPHQVSGGQRQRVGIARAIILRPAVLLADEPTSALDVSVQAQVLNLFKKTRREFGLTCIFVSHNLSVIRYVSDEVAVLRRGRVVERGSAKAIFSAPQNEYTRALIAAIPDLPAVQRCASMV